MKKILFVLVIFLFPISWKVLALTVDSKSLVAMDMDSKRVFYEINPDDERLIASTTKIMTAILAIESNKLEDIVEAKEEILTMYGTNIYLEYHEHMLLLDLIYGLMLRSGNDAAVVIASYVGGSVEGFVNMMNNKAKELGMTNTFFTNPTGLDDETENYSTARDLAILYSYAYQNATFRKIVSTTKYTTTTDYKSYVWLNRNELLSTYKYATGGKTGYTPKAGRVLVTSASKDDLNIVIASFNSVYDYANQERIYEDIFDNYEKVMILDKDNFSLKNDRYDGTYYINNSFSYPLTENEEKQITRKVDLYDLENVQNNDKVGEIYVYLNDEIFTKEDVYLRTEKLSLLDKIKNFFKNLLAFDS